MQDNNLLRTNLHICFHRLVLYKKDNPLQVHHLHMCKLHCHRNQQLIQYHHNLLVPWDQDDNLTYHYINQQDIYVFNYYDSQ